jgi:hypothetical protein
MGNFIVVWSSDLQDSDILGRLYDAEGNPKGPEFHVNPAKAFGQAYPAAAFDSAGNFVVVWSSFNQDGSTVGVHPGRTSWSTPPRRTPSSGRPSLSTPART